MDAQASCIKSDYALLRKKKKSSEYIIFPFNTTNIRHFMFFLLSKSLNMDVLDLSQWMIVFLPGRTMWRFDSHDFSFSSKILDLLDMSFI